MFQKNHRLYCTHFVSAVVYAYSFSVGARVLGNLSTRVFETRTATGSELFSLLTCLQTSTFISPSVFSLLEMISIKLLGTSLSWDAKCSLPVAVCVSKTRVLKLPIATRRSYII